MTALILWLPVIAIIVLILNDREAGEETGCQFPDGAGFVAPVRSFHASGVDE